VLGDDRNDATDECTTTEEPAIDAAFLARLSRLETAASGRELGRIGLHLMPLLRSFEREFAFGLPLQEIERCFAHRACGNTGEA